MLMAKKVSTWQFVTSSSGWLGVGFVAAEGGTISLKDPLGNARTVVYGGAGPGLSEGFKVPVLGKKIRIDGRDASSGVAPSFFPNTGIIYILDSFSGDELSLSDIRGVCAFLEVEGGLIGGASGTAMLLGMDPILLAEVVAASVFGPLDIIFAIRLLKSATSVLLMAGTNAGLQAGGGGAICLGVLV